MTLKDRMALLDVKIDSGVEEHGWFAMHVFPTEEDAPSEQYTFTYTVGFPKTLGVPDVLVTRLRPEDAHALFAGLYEVNHAYAFVDGGYLPELAKGNYLACLRTTQRKHYLNMFGVAQRFNLRHGITDLGGLQLVLPDVNNLLPWQKGYSMKQPLLYDMGNDKRFK